MEWESMYSSQMEAHGSSNETHKEWKLLSLVSPNTSPSSLFPETITAVPGQTHLHNKLTHTSQQHQGCQTQIEHRLREAVWFNFRLKIQSWKITSFFFPFHVAFAWPHTVNVVFSLWRLLQSCSLSNICLHFIFHDVCLCPISLPASARHCLNLINDKLLKIAPIQSHGLW